MKNFKELFCILFIAVNFVSITSACRLGGTEPPDTGHSETAVAKGNGQGDSNAASKKKCKPEGQKATLNEAPVVCKNGAWTSDTAVDSSDIGVAQAKLGGKCVREKQKGLDSWADLKKQFLICKGGVWEYDDRPCTRGQYSCYYNAKPICDGDQNERGERCFDGRFID